MRKTIETIAALLSPREAQVFGHLLLGKPNKTIARELSICERTVKYHCTNIYKKLKIRNRASILRLFV